MSVWKVLNTGKIKKKKVLGKRQGVSGKIKKKRTNEVAGVGWWPSGRRS